MCHVIRVDMPVLRDMFALLFIQCPLVCFSGHCLDASDLLFRAL